MKTEQNKESYVELEVSRILPYNVSEIDRAKCFYDVDEYTIIRNRILNNKYTLLSNDTKQKMLNLLNDKIFTNHHVMLGFHDVIAVLDMCLLQKWFTKTELKTSRPYTSSRGSFERLLEPFSKVGLIEVDNGRYKNYRIPYQTGLIILFFLIECNRCNNTGICSCFYSTSEICYSCKNNDKRTFKCYNCKDTIATLGGIENFDYIVNELTNGAV